MAGFPVNRWALRHYRALTEHTVLSVLDELEAQIAGTRKPRVLSSTGEAYALASRFKNVLYRHPYFKKKHQRILRAIVDRCGEAHYKKDLSKLYISKSIVEEWAQVFRIPEDRISMYLKPLLLFGILEPSDRREYVYKVSDGFYRMMGPVAQYLVAPVEPETLAGAMSVASGISSVYVLASSVRLRKRFGEKPLIPWFVKLSMIYTLTGLEPGTLKIRDVLELERIHAVDAHFVKERMWPVEWWRSVRAEAFEFMADNTVIEKATPNGYRLNRLWLRVHEEGVRRFVGRLRRRYKRRFRG